MNEQLKQWLISNKGVDKDASEKEFKKAAAECLVSGDLSRTKYLELTTEEEDRSADEFAKRFDRLADGIEAMVAAMGTKAKDEDDDEEPKPKRKPKRRPAAEADEEDEEEDEEEEAAPKRKPKPKEEGKGTEPGGTKGQPTRLAKMIGAMGTSFRADGVDVRVKEAVESYSDTKSTLTYPHATKAGRPHALAGQPVRDFGRAINTGSEKDLALCGAYAKWQIMSVTPRLAGNPRLAFEMLNDHEKSLLCHLAENEDWDDSQDGKMRTAKGYRGGVKALIDDAVTGGIEAAPIVFDDRVIETPLLHGELFPLVTTYPLDRGRRIEGVAVQTVTSTWGGVDATPIGLFDTTAYVSAFDTTVYRWEGAVRIGLDFISDTPIDFGALITRQYGERLLEDLDNVVATGNGATQPLGVMNAGGTATIGFGGTTTIGNYESLRFGVSKAEHRPDVKASAVFCGTETSYMRAKALPLGAADARRLFAYNATTTGNYDDYAMMDRPYKINESLANTQVFYAILARYRMYRRKGIAIRTSTEGETLMRNNLMLITAMARYGGQMERGACAAVTTTAPA